MHAWFSLHKEVKQHCQKSVIASLEDNYAKMKEQIEQISQKWK